MLIVAFFLRLLSFFSFAGSVFTRLRFALLKALFIFTGQSAAAFLLRWFVIITVGILPYFQIQIPAWPGLLTDIEPGLAFTITLTLLAFTVLIAWTVRNIHQKEIQYQQVQKDFEWFSRIVEQTTDLVYVTNRNGIIEYVNPSFEKVTGYTREMAIGRKPSILKSGRHNPEFYEKLWSTILSGVPFRATLINRKRDGTLFYEEKTITPLKNRKGEIIHFVSTGKDVTETSKVRHALEQITINPSMVSSELFFQTLVKELVETLEVSYALIGEVVDDKLERIRTVAVCSEGVITDNFEYDLAHTPCENVLGKRLCTYAQGVHKQFPLDRMLADMKVESYMGVPLFSSKGQPIGILVVMDQKSWQSVSFIESVLTLFAVRSAAELERKHVQQALLEINRDLQAILSSTDDAIFTFSADQRIRYCNQAAEKIFGYHTSEMIGQTAIPFYPTEQDYWNFRKKMLPELQQSGYVRGEFQLKRANGEIFPAEYTINLLRSDEREMATVAVIRDISDRKLLEQELRQSQKMEAIGGLAGGIAHDFNNLLMGITGFCELLKMQLKTDDPASNIVNNMLKVCRQGAVLTQQLLAFSRKQVLDLKVFNINELLQEMRLFLQRLIREDVQIQYLTDPDVWMIQADPTQIQQIIINLATNAQDAMPQGGILKFETGNISLTDEFVRTHAGARTGDFVFLKVSDTGKGIDSAILSHIFEPFFTTKELGKGTGLGLATVYGTVKQHNGYIDVTSQLEKGTTFQIFLPRSRASPEFAVSPSNTPVLSGKETILLVDDDDFVRSSLQYLLQYHGYTVLVACDGHQAIEMAARTQPETIQLLITDHIMPGMSGSALAQRLRTVHAQIKVLYLSGYSPEMLQQQGPLESGTSFLQKPVCGETLLGKIRELLES